MTVHRSSDRHPFLSSGAGTPGTVDTAGGDVYIADDLEVDGVSYLDGGAKIIDNQSLIFGTDTDWTFKYDETTTDSLILSEGAVETLYIAGSSVAAMNRTAANDTAGNDVYIHTEKGGTDSDTSGGENGGTVYWVAGNGSNAGGGDTNGGDGGGFHYQLGKKGDLAGAGADGSVGSFTIENEDDDEGAVLNLWHDKRNAADGVETGKINFYAENDDGFPGADTIVSQITSEVQSLANGSEEQILRFKTMAGGSLTEYMRLDGTDGVVAATFSTKVQNATATQTAVGPTDNLDVSGVNVVKVNTNGNNVTIGGFTGGVDGQVLHVVIIDASNNTTLEHAEATGNQDIYLESAGDETKTATYGGWTLICNGTHWYQVK